MAVLTIRRGHLKQTIVFEAPQPLARLLSQADAEILHPCGGRGVCGKCAVMLSGNVSVPNAAELRCGVRLSCQATILGDAEVTLPALMPMEQIAGGNKAELEPTSPMDGKYGAAVDIGTTTIALLLYDLATGRCLGASSMLNPQWSVAADVIGRIDAAMKGQALHLRQQVENAIQTLLASACAQAELSSNDVQAMTVTGNTTMLYLLTGREPSTLSRAPFEADHLFGHKGVVLDKSTYLPECLHAFVGADTSCAILASGMLDRHQTALLCDVGTNGELALWHRGVLYIASTAAGPAFEGAGISCGCASIPGAIDKVQIVNGKLHCHTIGKKKPVGICGSGLLDAVAALLDTEVLDGSGYLEDDPYLLDDNVNLSQGDIRAVQLAKAAIHAGIISLLDAAQCDIGEVEAMYLAGGFGSHLNLTSAVRIGLFPAELSDRVHVIGNAALDGAALLLLDITKRADIARIKSYAQHVRLDGNPVFADNYINAMLFDEE